MKVLELFSGAGGDYSLNPLNSKELATLETLLIEKNQRLYFRCPVRNAGIEIAHLFLR
jgi:hypothetical protein